MTIILLNISCC